MILEDRMKHGQNPELRSVVSGVGTKNYLISVNIIRIIILVLLEIGTVSPPVLKWNNSWSRNIPSVEFTDLGVINPIISNISSFESSDSTIWYTLRVPFTRFVVSVALYEIRPENPTNEF